MIAGRRTSGGTTTNHTTDMKIRLGTIGVNAIRPYTITLPSNVRHKRSPSINIRNELPNAQRNVLSSAETTVPNSTRLKYRLSTKFSSLREDKPGGNGLADAGGGTITGGAVSRTGGVISIYDIRFSALNKAGLGALVGGSE